MDTSHITLQRAPKWTSSSIGRPIAPTIGQTARSSTTPTATPSATSPPHTRTAKPTSSPRRSTRAPCHWLQRRRRRSPSTSNMVMLFAMGQTSYCPSCSRHMEHADLHYTHTSRPSGRRRCGLISMVDKRHPRCGRIDCDCTRQLHSPRDHM